MSYASTIHICAYCPEQHIESIEGDPSPELVERVEREHLPTRKVSPELVKALEAENCTLSHGLCEKAMAEAMQRMPPGLPDSGITPGGIQARLRIRAYVEQGGEGSQKGAFDFHQVVQNLIEQGADRDQLVAMLGRIRDSYPEGDHHRGIAQAEISWVQSQPTLSKEPPNDPGLN